MKEKELELSKTKQDLEDKNHLNAKEKEQLEKASYDMKQKEIELSKKKQKLEDQSRINAKEKGFGNLVFQVCGIVTGVGPMMNKIHSAESKFDDWTDCLKVGDKILAKGLTSEAGITINGKEGTLISFNEERKRWDVQFTDEKKSLQTENLVKITENKKDK